MNWHHLRKISSEMHTVVTNPISNSITGSLAGKPLARADDGLLTVDAKNAAAAARAHSAPIRPPCVRRTLPGSGEHDARRRNGSRRRHARP
ncbi:hypothetical protein BDAG_01113 [Burkholderia dolosa AU0158]|nr:hypothetical protein BDAG_01113 [Burkholderia dolosa AU0158]